MSKQTSQAVAALCTRAVQAVHRSSGPIVQTRMPTPTDAIPGSPEKVRVLEARYLAGESLWHPLDARRDEE